MCLLPPEKSLLSTLLFLKQKCKYKGHQERQSSRALCEHLPLIGTLINSLDAKSFNLYDHSLKTVLFYPSAKEYFPHDDRAT